MNKFGENIWIFEGEEVRFHGMPYTTRMTVVKLSSGKLFIHSPIRLTEELQSEVSPLGEVAYLISPNKIHHLFMEPWAEKFPEAQTYLSPGLEKKRPDMEFKKMLENTPESEWKYDIDQAIFYGSKAMQEVIFFHKQSSTLILADLIENFDPKTLKWPYRLIYKLAGILAPHGRTPLDWRMSFTDKKASRESFQKILSWNPQNIILAHGLCIKGNATDFLKRSFSWV